MPIQSVLNSVVMCVANRTGLLRAAAIAGVALALAGCSGNEVYVYESTPMMPQTVTLVNTATGEKVWTCEVPVGQRLDLRFANTLKSAEETGSDEMSWQLSGVNAKPQGRRSTVKVPPPSHRRLDLTQRPQPEIRK